MYSIRWHFTIHNSKQIKQHFNLYDKNNHFDFKNCLALWAFSTFVIPIRHIGEPQP